MVAEPTTTNVGQTILNIMTKSQYDQITPSPTELYMVTDGGAGGGAVDDVEVNGASVVSGGVANITTAGILPSQASQSGKFLTTDGTDASWATVDALPSQSGQSGKFLTTNGSVASWAAAADIDTVNKKVITQGISNPVSGALTLGYEDSIYSITPSGTTAFTFDATGLNLEANTAYTFEVFINMSTVYTITFPNSVTWQDNTAPDLSSTGKYLLAFRTMDGGSTWMGNLQGVW